MRQPIALSYSAFKAWQRDPVQFYQDRLATVRSERAPQTRPMAIGSALDAFVKNALATDVLGTAPDDLLLRPLFEKQVEQRHWKWSWEAGRYVLDSYRRSGAYGVVRDVLAEADSEPRFEFRVSKEIGGVPLLGNPDLYFSWRSMPIPLDWKVRGYFSSASPTKGYVLCRDGWTGKQSRTHNKCYPKLLTRELHGLPATHFGMEDVGNNYAEQMSLYAWLSGVPVGDESFLAWIEELLGSNLASEDLPRMRVATHRGRIGAAFQRDLLEQLKACWQAITSDHVFRHLSRDQSQHLCSVLEQAAVGRKLARLRHRTAEEQVARIRETWELAA
jgi:hypothetical protein